MKNNLGIEKGISIEGTHRPGKIQKNEGTRNENRKYYRKYLNTYRK